MLKYVNPLELSAEDFAALYCADSKGPSFNSISPQEAVRGLWNGSYLLYKAPAGLFMLEINEGGDKTKRLNIVRMAGNDLVLHFEEISRDLQHIARERGCVAIETMVYDEKLAKALTRGGAQQESITMVLELDNG